MSEAFVARTHREASSSSAGPRAPARVVACLGASAPPLLEALTPGRAGLAGSARALRHRPRPLGRVLAPGRATPALAAARAAAPQLLPPVLAAWALYHFTGRGVAALALMTLLLGGTSCVEVVAALVVGFLPHGLDLLALAYAVLAKVAPSEFGAPGLRFPPILSRTVPPLALGLTVLGLAPGFLALLAMGERPDP